MTFIEKFAESESRAHSQLVATKLDGEMRKLRSQASSSPTARRRWGWELIQNAKDVHHGSGVEIEIHYDQQGHALFFRHSGKPFTADNIRFLIEQISTKDRGVDEHGIRKQTGRFGTGFLSTHLLSEIVHVTGVAEEPSNGRKQFTFTLDRSGKTPTEFTLAVENAKKSLQRLDSSPDLETYDATSLNTVFQFTLTDPLSHQVAKDGIADLQQSLPYTLIFVPEVNSVLLRSTGQKFKRSYYGKIGETQTTLSQVTIETMQGQKVVFSIATVTKGLTSVSVPVVYLEGGVFRLLRIEDNMPRLFCDFPLVGTETFPFPAIINNPHFDPTDPRDGVYLLESERERQLSVNNRKIIAEAIECYRDLARCAINGNWQNLHLLADVRQLRTKLDWVSSDWFNKNVATPIRNIVSHEKIVSTAGEIGLSTILDVIGDPEVWFPVSAKPELRAHIWRLASEWFPNSLPSEAHVELWYPLLWEDCGKLDSEAFCDRVARVGSMAELEKQLSSGDSVAWLNRFYVLLQSDEKNTQTLMHGKQIFPNQNGAFCNLDSLYADAGNIEEELKDILLLLGLDIRSRLANSCVDFDVPGNRVIDRAWVVGQIERFVYEKCDDAKVVKSFRPAFDALLKWFRANPELASTTFPSLHRAKYRLYDEDAVIENMDKAEQLEQLLADSGLENIGALRELLEQKNTKSRLPLSEAILASLGITSIDDWQEALKDKDLAEMFAHESTPTTEMFLFVQGLITRAKSAVAAHLQNLPEYDLSEMEETAPTVFGGIKKHGREIQIVVRPAYSGEVIIYYPAERNVLDFVDGSELWADTGDRQFEVTLGHILKKTRIQKFPI